MALEKCPFLFHMPRNQTTWQRNRLLDPAAPPTLGLPCPTIHIRLHLVKDAPGAPKTGDQPDHSAPVDIDTDAIRGEKKMPSFSLVTTAGEMQGYEMLYLDMYCTQFLIPHGVLESTGERIRLGHLEKIGCTESIRMLPTEYHSYHSSNAITWPLATLRCLPVDVLAGILDIAGLAVDAAVATVSDHLLRPLARQRNSKDLLLRIDLETHTQIFRLILHVLIHASRTESVLYALVLGIVHLSMGIPILDL